MSWEPTVSIIVPCYNVAPVVERCATSLMALDYPQEKLTIVFVNDGSTDSTVNRLKEFERASNIVLINHEQNRGLAAARNTGIRATPSEVICFLDSDMSVSPDWLRTMLAELSADDVVGVMGDNRLADGLRPNALDRYFYSRWRGARKNRNKHSLGFQWFLFHNTALKRRVIDRVGMFDECITTYGGEDTDLAIRIWEAFPDQLRFTDRATSQHHHQRTVAQFCRAMEQYGYTNLPVLLRRYPQHRKGLAGDWIHSLKGRLVFNCFVRRLVRLACRIYPAPALIRYLVVDSVIRGARRFYETNRLEKRS
ncbi:MAG: glycosyltransferase [FCB group bacterium]|nr:glycosyltransferase [FCB group bacterium]